MPRKGMDMATKKRLALEHLHDSKSVWSPKELPNEWTKKKGIAKSAGEKVIEELLYDDSIRQEKIGSSKYIWAFKSEKRIDNKNKLSKLESEIAKIESDIKKEENYTIKLKSERTMDNENRKKAQHGIGVLQNNIGEIEEKIKQFEGGDPQKLKEYENAIQIAKDAAERWTDNIYAVIKFIKSKKSNTEAEILKHF
eukprot:754085_1